MALSDDIKKFYADLTAKIGNAFNIPSTVHNEVATQTAALQQTQTADEQSIADVKEELAEVRKLLATLIGGAGNVITGGDVDTTTGGTATDTTAGGNDTVTADTGTSA